MAKASPTIRAFNGGEWSELLAGRSDIEQFQTSAKEMSEYIAAPQGPAIGRSGTQFIAPVQNQDEYSVLVPFVFDRDDILVLEVSETRTRFFTEDGIVAFPVATATVTSAAGDPIIIDVPGFATLVNGSYPPNGWQIVLSGFPEAYNLNGQIAEIQSRAGNAYTLDISYPNEAVVDGGAYLVYQFKPTIPWSGSADFTEEQLRALRFAQSLDVIYFTGAGTPPLSFGRYGAYDWRDGDWRFNNFNEAPYMPIDTNGTTVTPSSTGSSPTMTFSSASAVNGGAGFSALDIGRHIRLKASTGVWRWCRITAVSSSTVVTVAMGGGNNMPNTTAVTEWRLGVYSPLTGYPTVAPVFAEDRMWLAGGGVTVADYIAASATADYRNFAPSDLDGTVQDTSGFVGRLNSRKLSGVAWMDANLRGIVIGTGSEEYEIPTSENEARTPRNISARKAGRRGSAAVQTVQVEDETVFVQSGSRTLREFTYSEQIGAYKSSSLSQLAGHLGEKLFAELDYAAEPYSIVWCRREDGTVAGLTYSRDEGVMGWHRHSFSGGFVESMCVVPNLDGRQDALWLIIRRTVNGQSVRYIERLMPFWDFGETVDTAHYADCALRYVGMPADRVYGLQHLEGREVYALVDGNSVGPFTVENGSISLPYEGANILVGLGFEARVVVPRIDAGASDGTANGKTQRVNRIALDLWQSFGGEVGVYSSQDKEYKYEPLEYAGNYSEVETVELFTGAMEAPPPIGGYELGVDIAFRRPASSLLPFNVVAIHPQLNTQDR